MLERRKGIDINQVKILIFSKEEEIQTNHNLEALVASHHVLEKATCGEVAGFSGRNPFYPIDATAPLLTALQLMAKNNVTPFNMHRNTNGD